MAATDPSIDASSILISIATEIAQEIRHGNISPYAGARRIWFECHQELDVGDHRLDPFVYWASEFEETSEPTRRVLCEDAIRQAAADLIQNGSAL